MMGNDDVSPTNGQPRFCRERTLGTRLVNGGEKMGTKIFGWLIAEARFFLLIQLFAARCLDLLKKKYYQKPIICELQSTHFKLVVCGLQSSDYKPECQMKI